MTNNNRRKQTAKVLTSGRNEKFAEATRTQHASAARPPRNKSRYNRNDFRNQSQRGTF